MARKYKTLNFKDFHRGEQQFDQILEDNPFILRSTLKLNYNQKDNNVNIAENMEADNIEGVTMGDNYQFVMVADDMFAIVENSGDIEIWKSTNGGAFSKIKTFVDREEAKGITYFAGKLIAYCTYWNGSEYVDSIQYSTDGGTNWTETTLSLGLYPLSIISHEEILYFLTEYGEVYTTTDGLTYSLLISTAGNEYYFWDLAIFQGDLYALKKSWYKNRILVGKIENGKFSHRHTFTSNGRSGTIASMGDQFLCVAVINNRSIDLYSYTSDSIQKFAQLHDRNYNYAYFIFSGEEECYLTASDAYSTQERIWQITQLKGCFQQRVMPEDFQTLQCFTMGEEFYLTGIPWNSTPDMIQRYKIAWDSYPTEASFYSDYINVGPHVPIGLIAQFEDGISRDEDGIEQYTRNIKIDLFGDADGDGFGTMDVGLLNWERAKKKSKEAVADEIIQDFALSYKWAEHKFIVHENNEISSIRFKIRLLSDIDNETTPQLYSLKYIYLPLGLETL